MSGFMLTVGSAAVVVGLASYPNRWIAVLFVGAVTLLFVRDLLAQPPAEDGGKPAEGKAL